MSAREWIKEKGSPVATLLLASVLIGGCIGLAARANADPQTVEQYAFRNAVAICDLLDQDPNSAGIAEVQRQLTAHGVIPDQVKAITVLAVDNVCPRHLSLLQALPPAPAPTYKASGRIGGVLR